MPVLIDRTFWLVDDKGEKYFPKMIRDRDTGAVEFRLSNSGNLKSEQIVTTDIAKVKHLVVHEGYRVRAVSENNLNSTANLIGYMKKKIVAYGSTF